MPNIKEIMDELVDRLVKEAAPDKVILFGSSRDYFLKEDSDVDLLIVMKTDLPRGKRYNPIMHIFRPRKFPMDILICTPDEVEEHLSRTNSVIKEAVETGRIVYEKSNG